MAREDDVANMANRCSACGKAVECATDPKEGNQRARAHAMGRK